MYIIGGFIMLAIRLPSDIETRLAHLAEKTGRTKTYYARKAILDLIEDMEDTYLALDRLEDPQKIWKQEDLEEDLDLVH
jgi:RHH-type rel operon transcriptional repressor/antitoxin RelB